MNIGMFTDSWLPTMDGCVSSVLKFKEGLEKRGHNVFIFAPESLKGNIRVDDRTFLFKSREFRQYPEYRMALSMSSQKDKLIRENDIEMLHTHGIAFMGFKAMLSSRVLSLPLLLHFHTWVTEAAQYYPFNLDKELMESLSWRYLTPFCQKSDGVVTPSLDAMEELKKKVPNMAYTDWVFPGIDVNRFNPNVKGDAIRQRYGLEDNEVILHLGRLSQEKNLELVLNAMTILKKSKPNARLLVAGDGPARDHYRSLVKEMHLEDRVIFTGFVPDAELPNYYAASDCFVLASKFETLGIVMTEALACGKPVAGIDFRVIPHVVKDGYNGYLFKEDAHDCAEKLKQSIEAPAGMKINALQSISIFDTEKCMEKMEYIYKRTSEIHEERLLKRGRRTKPIAPLS